jgi:hypothetical protein
MTRLSSAIDGSFAPTLQFVKLEIHKVFRRFPNFDLKPNLSPITLANRVIACFIAMNDIWISKKE